MFRLAVRRWRRGVASAPPLGRSLILIGVVSMAVAGLAVRWQRIVTICKGYGVRSVIM